MTEPQKTYYTWQEFHNDCKTIAEWARDKDFKTIYGIPRGGLIVAVCLSHLLDLPIMLSREDITKQTLIVDDIVDSGNTINQLYTLLGASDFHVASLYLADGATHTPAFFARQKTDWVVFPWETEGSSKYDGTEV